jgi:CubicO group peptidase (beta-lactamase class C family)
LKKSLQKMKRRNRNIAKKGIYLSAIVLAAILIFSNLQCRSINPKLQKEYLKPGTNQKMQEVFDRQTQSIPGMMKESKIPGLSIAVVDREGVIWTAGFGYTDYDCKTPVTPETIFSIQSMSKTFTATAVMIAVQDGLVDLDTPITEYLPDFKVNSRFEDNPQDKMTLQLLLSHRAGFVHEAPVGNNFDNESPSYEAHIKSISDTWLKFPVGAKYSYSNLGIDLAAYIIQVRSGLPFKEYMKEKIFEPLGMTNSSVDMEFIRQHPNRAIGHSPHFNKVSLEIPMVGAGGVYTSADELAKFIQFHLNQGKVNDRSVLDEKLVKSMSRASYGLCIAVNILADGKLNNPFSNEPDISDGAYMLNHGGGGFGFLTFMGWLPEYGFGLLVLTNSTNHDSQHVKLAANLADELISKRLFEKIDTFESIPSPGNNQGPAYQPPDSNTFTQYKPEWKKYTGTYKYITNFNLRTYARVALALGYPELQLKVYEKNGFLEINGERLDEYLPGFFFTCNGDYLDLRGPALIWNGTRIKKK